VTSYELYGQGQDGSEVRVLLHHTPPPVPPPLRIGLDCTDSNLTTDLALYPKLAYHRVFGPGALPRHDGLKLTSLPPSCIPHVSWKTWDEAALVTWLADVRRPMYLTYHHEPMGDIDPGLYVERAARAAELAKAQPLILGTGPILTRYWLEQGNGNPDIWRFAGQTFWGIDCYALAGSLRYVTPEEMFGAAVFLGRRDSLPVLIPEWGIERLAGDTAGQLRAQSLRDSIRYLRDSQVAAVGYWNIDAARRHRLQGDPERATYQTLVDMQ